MSRILVGIYDEYKLIEQGISSLLSDNDDIQVVVATNNKTTLNEKLKAIPINVLIYSIHDCSALQLNHIIRLNFDFPKIKILVFSTQSTEEAILKTIKSGAKGFLDKDSGRKELVEAIHTLRNGHDYYSESITHLLLKQYINKIKTTETNQDLGINALSSRQIEVLKLWGESYSNQEIADKLFISQRTVETHKNHIMVKLNLKTSVDMIKFAIKNNLIEI